MIQGDNVRRNKTLVTLKESKGIPRKCVAASGENTRTLKVRSRERGGGRGGVCVCVCITNSPGRGQLHYVSLN